MIGNINMNTPLQPVTLQMATGKKAFRVNNAVNYAINGFVYAPIAAADVAVSNSNGTPFTVETGNYALFTVYATTAWTFEIEKSKEYANWTTFKFADILKTTKSVKVPAQWTANVAYTTWDIVVYEMNYYTCNTNHTSGASFDTSKFSFSLTPDASSRAIFGYVLVSNATGSQYVGWTTDLDTASLTVYYIAETPYTAQ